MPQNLITDPAMDLATEVVAQAKSRLEGYNERLLHLVSFVPDDKLAWTPSLTTRSAVRLVTHCALVSRFFASVITETLPEKMPSPEAFFQRLHAAEKEITTRESAVALMNETMAELYEALDTVTADNIESAANSPFGAFARPFWIDQSTGHLAGHIGQLEYLQTIWGDLDNHLS